MESIVIATGFVIIFLLLLFVIAFNYTSITSFAFEAEKASAREDLERLIVTLDRIYSSGYVGEPTTVTFPYKYNFYVGERIVVMERVDVPIRVEAASSSPLVPTNISSTSSVNITYSIYSSSWALKIEKA